MKKTLIALAALASTAAFAQSVTLSGAIGAAVSKDYVAGSKAKLGQTDGVLTFAATEDLGGGLSIKASQSIEWMGRAATNDGAAQGVQARDTKVTVAGGFGTVDFWKLAAASNNLSSLASLSTDVNGILGGDANLNYLRYTAPTFVQGLTLQAGSYQAISSGDLQVDNIGTTNVKTFVKASYATGPASGAIDYRTVDGRTRVWAGYDLGVAKLDYAAVVAYKSGVTTAKQSEVGVTVPMGATTLGLHYGKMGVAKGTEVAAVYALSKRTNVNFSYGNLTNSSGVSGNASRVRLMHTF